MINKSKNILTTWNLSHIGKENEYLEFIQKEKKIPKINFIDKYHNNEKYLNSIKKLFLLSMKKEIILESFHSLKKDLKNKNSTIKECNLNKCFLDNNIFCFNSDGKIYPCNRLVDKKYCLGDVFNNYSLNYMLNNSMIIKKIKKMRDCCNLSKESVCQGYGCFAEKNKVSCKIFKKLF